jgi:hypothetical protein
MDPRAAAGEKPVTKVSRAGNQHGRSRSLARRAERSRTADLDVALKLAAEGSKACNRKIEARPFL